MDNNIEGTLHTKSEGLLSTGVGASFTNNFDLFHMSSY